jgi:hypothetical protein
MKSFTKSIISIVFLLLLNSYSCSTDPIEVEQNTFKKVVLTENETQILLPISTQTSKMSIDVALSNPSDYKITLNQYDIEPELLNSKEFYLNEEEIFIHPKRRLSSIFDNNQTDLIEKEELLLGYSRITLSLSQDMKKIIFSVFKNENAKTEIKQKEKENNQKDENKNESPIQEVDPREDINNIENKFNPKREESYWLEDLYDRLEKCLLMGKEPLEKFGFLFNQYKADLDIEPEQYVKNLDDSASENGNAVHVLRDDIIKHQNLYDQIKKEIKETIQVSYFNVNCKDVRDTLLNKHAKIKELELSCLNKKSQDIKTSVFKQVEEMKSGITKQSKNIEELVEIEKYIEDVPNLLVNLK